MNSVYIRNKYNINNLIKLYIIALIPLILYGVYKNGVLLYQKDLISLVEVFKPLIYLIIPIILILVFNYLKYKKIKLELNNLSWLFIPLFVSINTNVLIYAVLLILFMFLDIKVIRNNKVDLSIIFILVLNIVLYITGEYTYKNIAESTIEFNYNLLDILFGNSVGGMSSTSLIFAMISFVILYSNIYYKKNIPIIVISLYAFLTLVLSFFTSLDFTNIAGIFIAVMLLGNTMKYAPSTYKEEIFYSVILSLLVIIFNFINYYESVFISIVVIQLIMFIINIRKTSKLP